MKKTVSLCAFVLSIALFSGCIISGGIFGAVGNGVLKDESRTTSSFSALKFDGVGVVIYIQSNQNAVEITADENLLPLITTTVAEGKLVVDMKNISRYTALVVKVYAPNLSDIEFNGVGTLSNKGAVDLDSIRLLHKGVGTTRLSANIANTAELNFSGTGNSVLEMDADKVVFTGSGTGSHTVDFDASSAEILLTGTGSMTAEGSTPTLSVTLTGTGSFNGQSLQSSTATATSSGTGSISVFASSTLRATLTGTGNIIYYGSPVLTAIDTGTGRIYAGN